MATQRQQLNPGRDPHLREERQDHGFATYALYRLEDSWQDAEAVRSLLDGSGSRRGPRARRSRRVAGLIAEEGGNFALAPVRTGAYSPKSCGSPRHFDDAAISRTSSSDH